MPGLLASGTTIHALPTTLPAWRYREEIQTVSVEPYPSIAWAGRSSGGCATQNGCGVVRLSPWPITPRAWRGSRRSCRNIKGMGFLSGKYAIVTGGTRGIGRAIAEQLLDEGASVAICGRSAPATETAVRELSSRGETIGLAADVADPASVEKLFQFAGEKFPGLDIVINNAGVGVFRPVGELSIEDWHKVISTNLSGSFYCSREALPRMKQRGGGYIINISSLAGKNPFAGGAAYNASKFGLNGFSEAMMLDHRYDNIRVSYIMPGSVSTDFGSSGEADWKIAPNDIADIVMCLLRMPDRTLVSRVEVRPTRPSKK